MNRQTLQKSVADQAARWWGWGGKKHEIYVATFGSHLFMTHVLQGRWAMAPSAPWICY